MKILQWEEFVETYCPEVNTLVEGASLDGVMFETYGDELEYVKTKRPYNIWTLVQAEDEEVLLNGVHYVNRLGYVVTRIPWKYGENIEVTF